MSFFINIGPKLASVIPDSINSFESYVPDTQTFLSESELTEEEFASTFHSLKRNKAPGFDNIHVNVIKSVFDDIKAPLMHVFKISVKRGVFPEKMKIAKVTPIFKTGKKELLTNYRPDIGSSLLFQNIREDHV